MKFSHKSIQWETSCFMSTDRWADGRTDMMKLIVAFRNFVNPPGAETWTPRVVDRKHLENFEM